MCHDKEDDMKNIYTSNVRLQLAATALFSSLLLSACFDKGRETDIPLPEVPANIVNIVQNALPGISLKEAEKEVRDEAVIYELEGALLNGKEYEIKIAADGTIIKIKLDD